jgi:hypothetical protein
MDSKMRTAIAANIDTLETMLFNAHERTKEAVEATRQGEVRQAIGSLSGIEYYLENALALYRAANALRDGHRPHRVKS